MSSRSAIRRYVIQDLDTGERFRFHAFFEHDSGYSISKAANWVETGIIGRSSPIQGYQDSAPFRITLTIPLHASMEQYDARTPEDVDRAMRFFLSMPYPDYSGGIKPPHRYLLIMAGQLWPLEVIPIDVDVNPLGPWDTGTGKCHRAVVRASFLEVDEIPKDYRFVRG